MSYPQQSSEMRTHPDFAEMRERFERTASSGPAIALEGLILLAGVYAAISPWVVHFTNEPNITVNNLIVGITVSVIALGMTTAPGRMLTLTWVVAPLGAWLVLSPWVVTADHGARAGIVWNNCFVGGVTAVLGLAAMALVADTARRERR
ncbi:SPW repeat protein [Streptomyces sp. NPDC006265]|uniref:SPW repeat protein n=1 Tax=Streptomyces sp. NPDC006265 TaxID=3156740 RepID=UPI0033B17EA9